MCNVAVNRQTYGKRASSATMKAIDGGATSEMAAAAMPGTTPPQKNTSRP